MEKIRGFIIILIFLLIVTTACNAKTQREEQKKQQTEEVITYEMKQVSLQKEQGKYQKMKYLQESYVILSDKTNSGELLLLDSKANLMDTIVFLKEQEVDLKDFYISENRDFYTLSIRTEKELITWYYDEYDKKGNHLKHQELGTYSVFSIWIAAESGCLFYDYDSKKISFYNKEGKVIWEKSVNNLTIDAMLYAEDGYFYIVVWNDILRNLLRINASTGKTEKEWETSFRFAQIPDLSLGSNKNEIYFCDESKGLYCYNLEKKTSEKLLDWIENNIKGSGSSSFCPWNDGFLCLFKGSLYQIISGKTLEKEIVTVGVSYIDEWFMEMVSQFNQQNENIQIEFQSYEKYSEPSSQLQLDIVSGNCPDIIDISLMDSDNLMKKGILLDLYPYMKKDSEMLPEKFIDNVLKLLEYDNKLYGLPYSFSLLYLFCDRQILQEIEEIELLKNGISIELLENLQKKYPEKTVFPENCNDPINFFYRIIERSGKVEHFFSSKERKEEFSKLLKFSKGLPERKKSENYSLSKAEQIRKGTLLFCNVELGDLEEFMEYRLGYKKNEYIFCGYPCSENNGITIRPRGAYLGISASCKNKEAAWRFVRSFFTEEKQEEIISNMPIRKDALEKTLNNYQYIDNGKKKTLPKKDKKNLIKLINLAGNFQMPSKVQTHLQDIVNEEAEAYFAEDRTLEETVDIIEKRVNLYVNEQK